MTDPPSGHSTLPPLLTRPSPLLPTINPKVRVDASVEVCRENAFRLRPFGRIDHGRSYLTGSTTPNMTVHVFSGSMSILKGSFVSPAADPLQWMGSWDDILPPVVVTGAVTQANATVSARQYRPEPLAFNATGEPAHPIPSPYCGPMDAFDAFCALLAAEYPPEFDCQTAELRVKMSSACCQA